MNNKIVTTKGGNDLKKVYAFSLQNTAVKKKRGKMKKNKKKFQGNGKIFSDCYRHPAYVRKVFTMILPIDLGWLMRIIQLKLEVSCTTLHGYNGVVVCASLEFSSDCGKWIDLGIR